MSCCTCTSGVSSAKAQAVDKSATAIAAMIGNGDNLMTAPRSSSRRAGAGASLPALPAPSAAHSDARDAGQVPQRAAPPVDPGDSASTESYSPPEAPRALLAADF